MTYKEDPLWQKISDFNLDADEASFPFSKKLTAKMHWSASYTHRAIAEYKRFIYLCCISPTGASPAPIVDEVWHLHLTYSVSYWIEFCQDTLGRDIHHHPSQGGAEELAKHHKWYDETYLLYRDTFGESPPADIWGKPQEMQGVLEDAEQGAQAAKTTYNEMDTRTSLMLMTGAGGLSILSAALGIPAAPALFGAVAMVFLMFTFANAIGNGSGDGSGSCSSGCGSSCGGGCGGGCCGCGGCGG